MDGIRFQHSSESPHDEVITPLFEDHDRIAVIKKMRLKRIVSSLKFNFNYNSTFPSSCWKPPATLVEVLFLTKRIL